LVERTHLKSPNLILPLLLCLTASLAHAQKPQGDAAPTESDIPPPAAVSEASKPPAPAYRDDPTAKWPDRVEALAAEVGRLERQVAEQSLKADETSVALTTESLHASRMAAGAAVTASLTGPWMWVFVPTMLTLIVILLLRPERLSRYFRRDVVHAAYGVRRWITPDPNPALRAGLLALAALLTLGFAFSARAQTPGPAAQASAQAAPPAADAELAIAQRFLDTEGSERLVARLELLLRYPRANADVGRSAPLPRNFPVLGSVSSGSAEHLAALVTLYAQLGRIPNAVALDVAFAAALQPDYWSPVPAVLAPAAVALADAQALNQMPETYARFRDLVTDVFKIVDMAGRLAKAQPQWAEALIAVAERRAVAPEDQLIVLGYRRAQGDSPELLAKLAALQTRINMISAPRALANVFAAAVRYKFPEIADPVLAKLDTLKLSMSDALFLLERAELVDAMPRVTPIVVRTCESELGIGRLLDAYDSGKRLSVAELAATALRGLRLAAGSGFFALREAMVGLKQRDLTEDAAYLFDQGLPMVRFEHEAGFFVDFSRTHLDDARIERALIRAADFMSRGELRRALETALEENRIRLAAGLAERLGTLAPSETYMPPESLELARSRAFYEAPVRVSTLANLLKHASGQQSFLVSQWSNTAGLVAWTILHDDGKLTPDSAMLWVNEITSLGLLLEAAGFADMGALVRGPVADRLVNQHGLTLPIPLALKPRWEALGEQRSSLNAKLDELQDRQARLTSELKTISQLGTDLRNKVLRGLPVVVATLLLVLLALWVATTRALLAARAAADFKAARFTLTLFESAGWQLMATLTLLPVGLPLVALAQWGLVPFSIDARLRKADDEPLPESTPIE